MDVTLPLDTSEFMDPGNWFTMPLIARLQPGIDKERAASQLRPMLQRLVSSGTTAERFRRRYLETVVVEPRRARHQRPSPAVRPAIVAAHGARWRCSC